MKIFTGLSFKNEKLPAKTGITQPAIRPAEAIGLINSKIGIQNNPTLMAHLDQYDAVNPASIKAANKARLAAAVVAVNDQIEGSMQFKNIRFGHHEEAGRNFAVVRDRETGAELKRIPAEAFLEIASRLREASGLLVDVVG